MVSLSVGLQLVSEQNVQIGSVVILNLATLEFSPKILLYNLNKNVLIFPGIKLLFHAPIIFLSRVISIFWVPTNRKKVLTCGSLMRFFPCPILELFVIMSLKHFDPFLSHLTNSVRDFPFWPCMRYFF